MVPMSPAEPSLCGDETESLSSEDYATSDSSEESSMEESSVTVSGKQVEWEASGGGVGEIKGEDEGFEPAPLG